MACTNFQPIVETVIAMNSFTPAAIAIAPKRIPIDLTLVMSKRKTRTAKTSQAIPVRRNTHHAPDAERRTSLSSNIVSTVLS